MVRRSMKKEFPSTDSVIISEDETPYVPGSQQQHSPSPSEIPTGPEIEMEDMDSQQTESVRVKGRLVSG